ncbi:beta family protein [Haemophilus influenzae]|uniref:Beta protein n=1 Tax=Haemophilus influenzae (strain PittGG) TaxID=374931 RepID=A5UES5_HAEIG|nr:hypothetical protein [Haemophilus influenzae]ABQ99280.1 hypothetical protein CGSHiGG_00925 [Haemophilus influenzae PittGG]MCK8789231.1 beta family protein [Haemophilus influenzae]MCK8862991.1 beta family protein [Haemophilus influenzae]MCK8946845.1 beta family protein [Haemophilus influenzae]MCK9059883.1 beta family protein [Haemophilus influenzae]
MINVNFQNYSYYPFLHTRNSEEEAFVNLSQEDKLSILPSFVLHNRKGTALTASLEKIISSYNGPFILFPPLSEKILNHITNEEKNIFDSSQYYINWQEFTSRYENAIPAILFNNNEKYLRNIIRQTINLENQKGKVAFRIRSTREAELAMNALAAMDDPLNAIIFIDSGYISDLTESYNISNEVLQTFKNGIESLNIVSLSTSFPSSPAIGMTNLDDLSTSNIKAGYIQQKEVDLYLKLSEKYEVLYGDYASIHPIPIDSHDSDGRWSARIDFATDEDFWAIFRMPSEHGDGYQQIANYIANNHIFSHIPESWGKEKILQASEGGVFGRSPSKWVGVRANTHMRRQILQTSFRDELDESF